MRDQGIDAFRGLAVLGMMLAHTTRVTLAHAQESGFRAWVSALEPAVSVAFLWLVGWSLERAFLSASHSGTDWRSWYGRALVRAATLYVVGVLLFVLQYGVLSPDFWASPDVLGTIAWAIVALGLLLPLGRSGLIGGTVATLLVTLLCERLAVHVSGVNAGPGAAFPLLAVAAVGACHALEDRDSPGRTLLWLAFGAIVGVLASALPGELLDQHPSQESAGAPWFWNHTVKGILLYGSGVAVVASVCAGTGFATRAWAAPLRLFGRHALVTYVGHLLVLGLVDRWLDLPAGWWSFARVALGLAVAFTGIAMALESAAAERTRRTVRQKLGLRI